MFLYLYLSDLLYVYLGLFSYYIVVLRAGIKSVNTGVVTGNKLDNQIFELSKLTPQEIKNGQLLSLKHFPNFLF